MTQQHDGPSLLREIVERARWAHEHTYAEDMSAWFREVLAADDPLAKARYLTAASSVALTRPTQPQVDGLVEEPRRFWLSIREPGCVPERKGPWPIEQTAKVLREVIAARPTAYIDYITLDSFGHPQIEHGPEVLQITDGRSMSTGRKHNQRVRAAEAALRSPEPSEEMVERRGVIDRADDAVQAIKDAIRTVDPWCDGENETLAENCSAQGLENIAWAAYRAAISSLEGGGI